MNQITVQTFYYFCNTCNKLLTSHENKYKMPITEFIKKTNIHKGKVTQGLIDVEVDTCQEKITCITCKCIKG